MAQAELPRHAQIYASLTEEQQDVLGKAVIEELRTLIGGYGELSVLAEYIAVMLQSNRPADMIQVELDAFLQEQSKPFTRWLMKEIEKLGKTSSAESRPADPGSEALLNRVMRDARGGKSAVKVETTSKRKEPKERRRSRRTAEAAPAPVLAAPIAPKERRSRSRRRRRAEKEAARAAPAPLGAEAFNENGPGADKKVVLTPNVQFLRDAYHQKGDPAFGEAGGPGVAAPGSPSKWHFRAEPLSPLLAPPQESVPARPPMEYGASPYGAQPAPVAPQVAPIRPTKTIPPKKWKVARPNTIVRETEHLQSPEVRTLQEGEIVEQVSPSLTMPNGIIRVLIRHPSSPQFPNPIGWVTSDATAAGGPKFLEPGPEPMSRGKPWAPPAGTRAAVAAAQNAQVAAAPQLAAAAVRAPTRPAIPEAPRGPKGFQNLVWTPS